MKSKINYRSKWGMSMALIIILAIVGCTGQEKAPTLLPAASSTTAASSPPGVSVESTATSQPAPAKNVLYQDNFTNEATGWSIAEFDNYFIGYHEPEYYHVEITSPNSRAPIVGIPEPEQHSYGDVTIELQVLIASGRTSPEGDFRYGLAFRRSGDQYYAFTISPRAKKWYVFKSSPNGLVPLQEGTDDSIHDGDVDDLLRVNAQGPNFSFQINNRLVAEVTDADYTSGEVGFYVESIDSPNTHIHFDTLIIRDFEAPVPGSEPTVLYQDNFTNEATGWSIAEFDNYFIGYHEPEYYHVEITSPNSRAPIVGIPEPEQHSYGDVTIELQVLIASGRTSPEGDFRYGLAFRRSGDQYYAFTISPRAKKWYVFKSSPNGLVPLQEGTDDSIHDGDVDDLLRVNAQGPNFSFHINDRLVGQVTDPDYTSGEVGFYVESIDSPNTHIHFDTLTIRNLEVSVLCNFNATSLYVRSGPGKRYTPIAVLSTGDTVEPFGLSADREWIKIKVKGSEDPGWVFISESFMSCNAPVDLLPIVSP